MPQGKVKWFNNAKGYGFVVEDGDTVDLFAHFSSIQMEGYKTLKAGQTVSFDKQPSGKGIHAVNIWALEVSRPKRDSSNDDEIISVNEPSLESLRSQSKEQTVERPNKVAATSTV